MYRGLIKTAGRETATSPSKNKKQDHQRARAAHPKGSHIRGPKRMRMEIGPFLAAKTRSIILAFDSTEVPQLATSSSLIKELNNLEHMGWIEIKCAMDSGAADSVALPSVLPQMLISPSQGPASGQTYLTANGTRLTNFAGKSSNVITNDMQEQSMTYQMVYVTRSLHSISRICDKQKFVVGFSSRCSLGGE